MTPEQIEQEWKVFEEWHMAIIASKAVPTMWDAWLASAQRQQEEEDKLRTLLTGVIEQRDLQTGRVKDWESLPQIERRHRQDAEARLQHIRGLGAKVAWFAGIFVECADELEKTLSG